MGFQRRFFLDGVPSSGTIPAKYSEICLTGFGLGCYNNFRCRFRLQVLALCWYGSVGRAAHS